MSYSHYTWLAKMTMRYLFIGLMCLMLLFAGVQYNDPDGVMWMAIYAVPAVWCALASFAPALFRHAFVKWALWGSLLASLAGVVRFWPLTPRFWTSEVWYNVETAREGMGLMIAAGVLIAVLTRYGRKSTPAV